MAKTAVSKSCDRSAALDWRLAGARDHALTTSVIAAQAPAPYHNARLQKVTESSGLIACRRAMIRFSKAYGTPSLGMSSRAAATNFVRNFSRFISLQFSRRPRVFHGYRYLFRAIFARHFRISA